MKLQALTDSKTNPVVLAGPTAKVLRAAWNMVQPQEVDLDSILFSLCNKRTPDTIDHHYLAERFQGVSPRVLMNKLKLDRYPELAEDTSVDYRDYPVNEVPEPIDLTMNAAVVVQAVGNKASAREYPVVSKSVWPHDLLRETLAFLDEARDSYPDLCQVLDEHRISASDFYTWLRSSY
jgi:hypothetical protein